MTYSINGRAGEPRVGVNPVSALTPGILRRIFEPAPSREAAPGGAHSLPPPDEAPQAEPAEEEVPAAPPQATVEGAFQPAAAAQAALP
jgi:hypothetical protein